MSNAGVAAASDAGAASPAGASLAMAAESAVAAAAGSGATPASATGSAGPDFWQPVSRAARTSREAVHACNFLGTPCSADVAQADLFLLAEHGRRGRIPRLNDQPPRSCPCSRIAPTFAPPMTAVGPNTH